ncbi:hypothetical protein [Polyangium jinanense]|uniref:Lipoprotein n=1 Tax=Polyangium jinanense TaxID=2829994 RepID=A0A9X3X619_9BACT|nr:hypothetical protein [Polyangium jinanense]MDC3953923.1 hypothetical protein [Polyangium jinanense]MDC3957864.1 hypothetical protein [Polyangium jinanense]MDC3978950.1 hypothetical protein [Polyangium jinanense]MDC3982121.1 hypothetical protein [Polyangium jinanense]
MKRFVTSLIMLALAGVGSLIGCSDDSNNTTGGPGGGGGNGGNGGNGGGGGGGDVLIPIDDIGTATAKLYCGLVYSCCTMAEQDKAFEGITPKPQNEAECAQTFKGIYDMLVLPRLKKAVGEGRMEYDGYVAASCLDKLEGSCTVINGDPFESDPECQSVFIGKVADGGDCSGDDECAGADSVCVGDTDTELGKCQPRGAAGAACEFDDDCATNYCDFQTSMCAAQKAVGEACAGFSQCKDSYCDSVTSVCTARKADGEACVTPDECSGTCDSMTSTCTTPAPICDGM